MPSRTRTGVGRGTTATLRRLPSPSLLTTPSLLSPLPANIADFSPWPQQPSRLVWSTGTEDCTVQSERSALLLSCVLAIMRASPSSKRGAKCAGTSTLQYSVLYCTVQYGVRLAGGPITICNTVSRGYHVSYTFSLQPLPHKNGGPRERCTFWRGRREGTSVCQIQQDTALYSSYQQLA